ncbi:MAG TPA: ATP-binding protein [Candidatus Binatia bacterium]|nr:ATP-binding protein [Candidatus Binatia bacterium]
MNFNHVPDRWLRFLHIFYILVDVVIVGAVAYFQIGHGNKHIIDHWGLTYVTGLVASVHLVYGLIIYPLLLKRNTLAATIVSQILFDLIIAAIIQASDYNNLVYRFGWMVTVGLSAMIGVYMVIGEVFVDAFLNFLAMIGLAKASSYHESTEWLLTSGVAIFGLIGWLVFKRFYEQKDPKNSGYDQLNRYLAHAQFQSNLIFQSIADGVIIFDVSGKISLINPAAARLTGWSVKDGTGLDIHLIMKLAQENGKPLDTGQDLFMLALEQKQHVSQTVRLLGRDNNKTTISLIISPIILPQETEAAGAVAVFRDITEERQQQQQRAEFISTASHEMRTPVAAIEGYLSLALNPKVSRIDSKAREFLEKAHSSTQNLGKLFQDLLTSARAEDGRLISHPAVIEMGEYLQQLVEELRFVAQKKQLTLDFTMGSAGFIDASKPLTPVGEKVMRPLYYVMADPDRLREVLTNLFDNAVKYTEQGKVTIGLTGDDALVQFFIRDTGQGIPADDIPHLFQKFYRVDNSATRTIGGTGLGLFISRKIIELYKGRIWVESTAGKGSIFYIDLPRLSAEKAASIQTTLTDPLVTSSASTA